MRSLFVLLLSTITIVPAALAAGEPVVHQFSAGSTARASQVNQNFQDLADRIGGVYDYRDFRIADDVTQLSYRLEVDNSGTAAGSNPDLEIVTRVATPNGFKQRRRQYSGGLSGSLMQCLELSFSENDSDFRLFNRSLYNTAVGMGGDCFDGTPVQSQDLTRAMPVLGTAMREGRTRSHDFKLEYYDAAMLMDVSSVGLVHTTALGVEPLSLNLISGPRSWDACLKVHTRWYSRLMGGDVDRLAWYCPGVGLTRSVEKRESTDAAAYGIRVTVRELSKIE